ncbi:MAG: dTDP-4-dehydrorhamnose 3,5-epimerase family protein [Owenweeksia sp.]|nr:dTDP-4-dehydrorhamnose 3,5-epimerase family protein [Owenweeksia sp.]
MFWVPAGFAHGFLTIKNDTIFAYKCSGPYNKESRGKHTLEHMQN